MIKTFKGLVFVYVALIVSFSANGQALETLKIISATIPTWVETYGVVEAVNQSTVSAQTSGVVSKLHFDVNDTVKQGDVILEIEDKVQSATLKRAKAAVTSAKAGLTDASSRFNRIQALYKQKAASQSDFDSAKAGLDRAKSMLQIAMADEESAGKQLSYTRIYAPYDGIVTARHVSLGETLNPGQPMLTGLSLSYLRVSSYFPHKTYGQVKLQNSFELYDSDGKQIIPVKYSMSQFADPRTHQVLVRFDLEENQTNLLPGGWVKVKGKVGEKAQILVPASAVIFKSEMTGVYVLSNEQPRFTQVRLGDPLLFDSGEHYRVLSGLLAGDEIVKEATAYLKNRTAHNKL